MTTADHFTRTSHPKPIPDATVPPEDGGSTGSLPRYERLRSLSRRLNDREIRRLGNQTMVSFERVDGTLVVRKQALDPAAATRLRTEAAHLRSIRHPGVVRLRSLDHDNAVLTTEFAGRATLATLLPDDVGTVAQVCASLCGLVDELHRSGWAHGALTADHCILGPSGRVVLCSFGHAARRVPAPGTADPDVVTADVETFEERRRSDRSAVALIGADLLRALAPASGRRDRADRRALRSALSRFESSGEDVTGEFHAIANRRERRGTASSAATRPGRTSATAAGQGPTPPTRARALAISLGSLACLLGLVVVLRHVGGPLTLPRSSDRTPGASPVDDVLGVVTTVLRIAAYCAAFYGVALSAATVLAVLTGRAEVQRVVASMGTPRIRAALLVLLGVGTVASAASPAIAAERPAQQVVPLGDASSNPVPPTDRPEPTSIGAATTSVRTESVDSAPDTTLPQPIPVPDAQPLGGGQLPDEPATAPTITGWAGPDVVDDVEVVDDIETWTVERGDHLWAIAETVMTNVHGGHPGDALVAEYWLELIEANRDVLVDPDNPDLIFTGQVLVLPPPR